MQKKRGLDDKKLKYNPNKKDTSVSYIKFIHEETKVNLKQERNMRFSV